MSQTVRRKWETDDLRGIEGGKRAWSPSNDNSIVLETSIKEEPVDFEEIEKVVANVAHVLAVNFTCEICNKSFSSKAAVDPYRSSDIEKS